MSLSAEAAILLREISGSCKHKTRSWTDPASTTAWASSTGRLYIQMYLHACLHLYTHMNVLMYVHMYMYMFVSWCGGELWVDQRKKGADICDVAQVTDIHILPN